MKDNLMHLPRRILQSAQWRTIFAWDIGRAILRRPLLKRATFIGVTGSAGKTTTKDLAAAILGQGAVCRSSTRSSNNSRAVALTVLKTQRDDQFCVIEMTGSFRNAMTWPLRIVRPQIAVITTIQREHATGVFNLEAIAEEKSKLVQALPPGGTAVLNIDDPHLAQLQVRDTQTIVWFGRKEGATVRLLDATSNWPQPLRLSVAIADREMEVETRLHGVHLATPILAALSVAVAAGVDIDLAAAAISQVDPHEGRMQVVTEPDGVSFIRDDWKAPAWSLLAPLQFLKEATAKRKIAVIGTISDYSLSATKQYKKAAQQVREYADLVIFVGDHAHRALRARTDPEDTSIRAFSTLQEASDYLQDELVAGDLVLLKGSCKADHLQRLLLNRQQAIQCWDQRCGINDFCDLCPRLYRPVPANTPN